MKKIYLSVSTNNIFISLLDSSGSLLYKDSGGMNCKRGAEKKTPKIAEKMVLKLKDYVTTNYSTESFFLVFRNHRYNDKGKIVSQLKHLIKIWPSEIILKEIINDNKVVKTTVRYKARRRV
jgi:ribosomal protein S11